MGRIEVPSVFPVNDGALLDDAEHLLSELASVFFPFALESKESESCKPGPEARYQVLVEQIAAVVFLAFLDQGIGEAYVSPQIEAILGFSQKEWLGDPVRWYRQIHNEDKTRWSEEAASFLLTGEPLARSIA